MFLTPPTVEELKESDLPDLIDMLSKQTTEYSRVLRIEGSGLKSVAIKEMILNIQAAISAKRVSQKSTITG